MHQLNLQELRNKPRYPAPQLSVQAAYRNLLTRSLRPAIYPQAEDFNRYGVGFWSPCAVAEGTRLRLNLKAGDILLQGIKGQVCNLRCIEGRYRIGVLFECYLKPGLKQAVLEAELVRLEKLVQQLPH